jgi:hypothetical protein
MYGLEPHRLTRLLNSLGAKDNLAPLQVFMTTHSPVAVRELSGKQICVVRNVPEEVTYLLSVGVADDVQSTVRADPEAFLARNVIVCEEASEVGFIRGLDHYLTSINGRSMLAAGKAYVNVGGGEPDRCFVRGLALRRVGYRVLVLVEADKPPTEALVQAYAAVGGETMTWRVGRALEDELFLSLPDPAIDALLQRAVELIDEDLVAAHIQSHSQGAITLADIRAQRLDSTPYTVEVSQALGLTARHCKNGWFKSVTKFEDVARDIVGPHLPRTPLQTWPHVSRQGLGVPGAALSLTCWVDDNPAFRTVVIITTLGNEDVTGFVNGIGPRAFVGCIPQAVFPAVDFALPNKYNTATAILIS